jgi:hypothetical protein
LIDAFWTNYPFCWGDGSGRPGKGSPIPECKGIKHAPGPGVGTKIDEDFWSNYSGGLPPQKAGSEYNKYFTSVHNGGPQQIYKLRKLINQVGENNKAHRKIKLLASIGGWYMGGSAAGKPHVPKYPLKPAWAALLKDPDQFAKTIDDILSIKIDGGVLYDGIDFDIETLYGLGCNSRVCTQQDKDDTVKALVKTIELVKRNNPDVILSASPRVSDIFCEHRYCKWNSENSVGFFGEVLQQLAAKNIYFDDINPQFYNDNPARNIPNKITNNQVEYGDQVASILKNINDMGILGPNTKLIIGVLAQTNSGEIKNSSRDGNPGLPKELLPELWHKLQTDPAIIASGVRISGIMNWSVNLALKGEGVGGNVRTVSSNEANVVPYNWPAGLWQNSPMIEWSSKGQPASADLNSGSFAADAVLKYAPTDDSLDYSCSLPENLAADCKIISILNHSGKFNLSGDVKDNDKVIITVVDAQNKAKEVISAPITINSQPVVKKLIWQQKPKVSEVTDTTANINWSAALSSANDCDISYSYYVTDNQGRTIASGNANSVSLTGLEPNSIYSITVTASAQGYESITDTQGFVTQESHSSNYNVKLQNSGNVAGYFYIINPDETLHSAGWPSINLTNINFSKQKIILKAWHHHRDTTTDIECPPPANKDSSEVTYIVDGNLDRVSCNLKN